MTEKEFIQEVEREVRFLKENATKDELRVFLDEHTQIDPSSMYGCVYGLMTGHCNSDRAKELMEACCVKTVHFPKGCNLHTAKATFGDVQNFLNGDISSTQIFVEGEGQESRKRVRSSDGGFKYLSYLEGYIYFHEANLEGIMDYLSDKTNKLNL